MGEGLQSVKSIVNLLAKIRKHRSAPFTAWLQVKSQLSKPNRYTKFLRHEVSHVGSIHWSTKIPVNFCPSHFSFLFALKFLLLLYFLRPLPFSIYYIFSSFLPLQFFFLTTNHILLSLFSMPRSFLLQILHFNFPFVN